MWAGVVSRLAVAAVASIGMFVFGVASPVPLSSGVGALTGSCPGFVGVAIAQTLDGPFDRSSGSCEAEKERCLAMHRQEDVWGNGYIPASDFSDCMKGYWYCKGQGG